MIPSPLAGRVFQSLSISSYIMRPKILFPHAECIIFFIIKLILGFSPIHCWCFKCSVALHFIIVKKCLRSQLKFFPVTDSPCPPSQSLLIRKNLSTHSGEGVHQIWPFNIYFVFLVIHCIGALKYEVLVLSLWFSKYAFSFLHSLHHVYATFFSLWFRSTAGNLFRNVSVYFIFLLQGVFPIVSTWATQTSCMLQCQCHGIRIPAPCCWAEQTALTCRAAGARQRL